MFKRKSSRNPVEISGQAFGVGVTLWGANAALLDVLREWLPPNWRQDEQGVAPISFRLSANGDETYNLERDGTSSIPLTLDGVARGFDLALRHHIATHAPAHVFVHAGAVAHNGKAIVIPGVSFSGKTTLVGELVRAGATYYSDEYAVIGVDGRVHPYVKPLSIRIDGGRGRRYDHASEIGAPVGANAAPLALVLATQYRRGAVWDPQQLTPAEAALELLQHALAGEDNAEQTLTALSRAATGTTFLKGDRGEAEEIADELLALVQPAG